MNDEATIASELQAAVFLIETDEPHVKVACAPERDRDEEAVMKHRSLLIVMALSVLVGAGASPAVTTVSAPWT